MREEIFAFVRNAPSTGSQLRDKLVAFVGYFGALRSSEIARLEFGHVKQDHEGLWISFNFATKTDTSESEVRFLLPANTDKAICPIALFDLYKEELGVRLSAGRLFKTFSRGKFVNTPVGKNSLASVPHAVANFLGLPNPEHYTGHTWCRSSATALADTGVSTENLKRLGRWKSEAVASSYVDKSLHLVKGAAIALAGSPEPSISSMATVLPPSGAGKRVHEESESEELPPKKVPRTIVMENCNNCTISFVMGNE